MKLANEVLRGGTEQGLSRAETNELHVSCASAKHAGSYFCMVRAAAMIDGAAGQRVAAMPSSVITPPVRLLVCVTAAGGPCRPHEGGTEVTGGYTYTEAPLPVEDGQGTAQAKSLGAADAFAQAAMNQAASVYAASSLLSYLLCLLAVRDTGS